MVVLLAGQTAVLMAGPKADLKVDLKAVLSVGPSDN
jgi:hypothetical protein